MVASLTIFSTKAIPCCDCRILPPDAGAAQVLTAVLLGPNRHDRNAPTKGMRAGDFTGLGRVDAISLALAGLQGLLRNANFGIFAIPAPDLLTATSASAYGLRR